TPRHERRTSQRPAKTHRGPDRGERQHQRREHRPRRQPLPHGFDVDLPSAAARRRALPVALPAAQYARRERGNRGRRAHHVDRPGRNQRLSVVGAPDHLDQRRRRGLPRSLAGSHCGVAGTLRCGALRRIMAVPDPRSTAMTASPQDNLSALYPAHLAEIEKRSADALAACGRDTLVIAAGVPHGWFLDDQDYPFRANPHFLHWLPLTDAPGSWIVYTPGAKPKLVFLQPHDYWHVVPAAPAGYWTGHFDIVVIRTADEARGHLPKEASRCAIIGEANAAIGDIVPDNPAPLLNLLHYRRAFKTPYEITMMRVASRIGVHGHRAAERAFREGLSEFDIHCEYLKATRLTEAQLPYGNIIALDAHSAVLHYMHFDRNPPTHAHSFLIDAGGNFHGYNSDITRTYASPDAGEFQALIDAVETAQQGFCAKVRVGQDYAQLHLHAHHVLMQAMHDQGFITCSAEAAVANGISSTFFPHGLGHL